MTDLIHNADLRAVLVINVSRIGDTLLALPAIESIAQAYPNAVVSVLAHPKRAEVFAHIPTIGRVGHITKNRALFMGWMGSKRYDLAFVFGYDEALVRYALRVAARVVAFEQKDHALNTRLYLSVIAPGFQAKHSIFMHLALTDAMGIVHANHRLGYRMSADEVRWAAETLRIGVPASAHPLIGLQIASFPTKGYRDWPLGHFIELVERILAHYPQAHFLIFGGKLERDRTRALHAKFAARSAHLAGALTLRQTAALMSRLDLYIGVDTGPTHIAGSFDVPMVVLYHAHSPSRLLMPLEHPSFVAIDHPQVGAGVEASMADITVDTVWAEVEAALVQPTRIRDLQSATA